MAVKSDKTLLGYYAHLNLAINPDTLHIQPIAVSVSEPFDRSLINFTRNHVAVA